jgi:hypothetical protein
MQDVCGDYRMQASALEALQEAAEDFLIHLVSRFRYLTIDADEVDGGHQPLRYSRQASDYPAEGYEIGQEVERQ